MSEPSSDQIHCPDCGKAYTWKPQLAGRKGKCACGTVFRFPDARPGGKGNRGGAEPSDIYELDMPDDTAHGQSAMGGATGATGATGDAKRAAAKKCPSCNSKLKPGAVICLNCGFNLKEGRQLQTNVAAPPEAKRSEAAESVEQADEDDDHAANPYADRDALISQQLEGAARQNRSRETEAIQAENAHLFTERWLPLGLIGAAIALLLVNMFVLGPFHPRLDILEYGVGYGIRFAIQFPVMLVSIFFLAGLFGSNYGTLGTALLKLAALCLLLGSVDDTIYISLDIMTGGAAWIGFILRWAIVFGVFYMACFSLFEMEQMEAGILFIIMIVAPTIILWGILILIFMFF